MEDASPALVSRGEAGGKGDAAAWAAPLLGE